LGVAGCDHKPGRKIQHLERGRFGFIVGQDEGMIENKNGKSEGYIFFASNTGMFLVK
jgi:hypothetical protein